jgi:phosphate starvation-inducible protein PhoH and related proteins
MRMFLTRLGFGSKAVVTGDVTQTDLPPGSRSGLREAHELLRDVDGIAFQLFTHVDVVRHPLVQKIVMAYDRRDARLRERSLGSQLSNDQGAAIASPARMTPAPDLTMSDKPDNHS